jgi:selenocysteine-specific elongation factor
MLAGAAGIAAVLLIVAADESVKPQTREHFEICRLLGIQHGMVVLTKADLASAERIARTQQDVRELCAGSFLENVPLVCVSAKSGMGLDELRAQLMQLAATIRPRDKDGQARLPVDRSFALKGWGTVVTGTLASGSLRIGETVLIHPERREGRIRGLQVHGRPVEEAIAGERTAVNLSGIDHAEIRRGAVLTHKGPLDSSKLLDVSLDWISERELPSRRERFILHMGTAERTAVVKVLEAPLARVWLGEPVLAFPGDRFVLRLPSPTETVAGGSIVDAFPPKRLQRAKTISRLRALVSSSASERIEFLVKEGANGRRLQDLARLTALSAGDVRNAIAGNAKLVWAEAAQRVLTREWIEEKREKLLLLLRNFHLKNPAAAGLPIAVARLDLEPALAAAVFDGFSSIRIQGDTVSLATHRARFSPEEQRGMERIEVAFRQAGFQPPAPEDVPKITGTDAKKARALLETLLKNERLVRISDGMIFHADVVSHIRKSLATHKGKKFSVPEFKEWTQISRKYAIPLLEYLDRQHVTRREGDARVIL